MLLHILLVLEGLMLHILLVLKELLRILLMLKVANTGIFCSCSEWVNSLAEAESTAAARSSRAQRAAADCARASIF